METPNFLQPVQTTNEQAKKGFLANKKWFSIVSLVVLVIGIPLAVWLLQKTQIFAPKADIKPIELVSGADSCVVSADPNKVSCASFPVKLTSPLGPPISPKEDCFSDDQCPVDQKCFNYEQYPGTCRPGDTVCAGVITTACITEQVFCVRAPCPPRETCVDFPSPCHVPQGWTVKGPSRSPSPAPSTPADITACLKAKLNLGNPLTAANKNNTTLLYWKSLVTLTNLKAAATDCTAQILNPTNFTPSVLETLVRGAGANPNRNVLVEGPCSVAKVTEYTNGNIKVSADSQCNAPDTELVYKVFESANALDGINDFGGSGDPAFIIPSVAASPSPSPSVSSQPPLAPTTTPVAFTCLNQNQVTGYVFNLFWPQSETGITAVQISADAAFTNPYVSTTFVQSGTNMLAKGPGGFSNNFQSAFTVNTTYYVRLMRGSIPGAATTLRVPSCQGAGNNRGQFSPLASLQNLTERFFSSGGPQFFVISSVSAQTPTLEDKLISWWRFNETTGDAAADSKAVSNATSTGTTIIDGKAANFGKARQTGVNGSVTAADNAAYSANAFTVGAWVKPTTFGSANYASIFSRRTAPGNKGFYLEYYGGSNGSSGQLQCHLDFASGGVRAITDANSKVSPNEWNFAACTWDGSNLKIYINGTLVKTQAGSGTAANPAGASILMGRNPIETEDFLNAGLDEVMYWTRALSDAEIQTLASGTLPGVTASPSASAVCTNLVKNFSFENPAVVNTTTSNGWQIYGAPAASTTAVTENIPDWDSRGTNAPYQVELHRALKGPAAEGLQYAEIDAPGVVTLTQSIPTQAGQQYQIKFVYSSRPDMTTAQKLGVYWNGTQIGTIDGTTHGSTGTDWQEKTFTVTGVAGTSKLGFGALADSSAGAGNFIDNISVVQTSDVCGNDASPSPGTLPGTEFYKIAETEAGLANEPLKLYSDHPVIDNFTFQDQKPGAKQIWVEFIGFDGSSRIEHISVELIEPEPVIASLDCSIDISKKDLKISLFGSRFGNGSGKVTANGKDARILTWSGSEVTATIKPEGSLEDGKLFKVVLTRSDGKALPEATCLVNTTVLSLGARLFCREPGKFDVSGVKVTLVDENGNKVNEEVTIDKDGLIKGLKTKLQVGKMYAISVKAPYSLRRNAQFTAANGTNVITPTEEANFILPVGDISPVILQDGKINTLDRSEIVRQWSVLGVGSNKTGDFNRDTKVNSIDWACMRYDFNKEDDAIPTKVVVTPTSTPSPSAQACPTSPVCPAGKTLIHGDPGPDWGSSCPVYACVDDGPGDRAAYFLLQPQGTGIYNLNQEFTMDMIFWSPSEAVNLLVGKLSFDPSVLEVVKIDKGGIVNCLASLGAPCPSLNWTEDSFDNQAGKISLAAGKPSPGLQTGDDGSLFATITFKAKKYVNGSTQIELTPGSKIYSNADNQDILKVLLTTSIAIPFPPD